MRQRVTVKLIPRIDLQALANKMVLFFFLGVSFVNFLCTQASPITSVEKKFYLPKKKKIKGSFD